MEKKNERLTSEQIRGRFKNQFDLVNYAIGLAADMIHSGRDSRGKLHSENPALQVLEEISQGKDVFVKQAPVAPKRHGEVFSKAAPEEGA